MTAREFDHIALSVENIQTSISWYKENLNAEVQYADDTWAMLLIGDVRVALTLPTQHPPHIAFIAESFSELGENPRAHRDGSNYIYKSDPDGNTVELIYWRENDK